MIDKKKLENILEHLKLYDYTRDSITLKATIVVMAETLREALKVVRAAQHVCDIRPPDWNMDGVPELKEALAPFEDNAKKSCLICNHPRHNGRCSFNDYCVCMTYAESGDKGGTGK